jgi:hypothetical protein
MIGDKNHPVTVSSAPILIPANRKTVDSKEEQTSVTKKLGRNAKIMKKKGKLET